MKKPNPLRQKPKTRFIASILGMQGAGKTQFLIQNIIPYCPKPVFILDTMNEYFNGLIFYNMVSLKHHLVKNNMNAQGVHILKVDNDEDALEFFELFTKVKQPATIIIEESDKFMGSSHYDINEDISNIINYGRHWGQSLIFVARRPARLNKDVTSQSNFIVSLKQTESNDIKALQKSYDNAVKLPELRQWNYGNPFNNGEHYLVFGSVPEDFKHII